MVFSDGNVECVSHWNAFLARLNSDLPEEQHLHLHTTRETFNENTGVTTCHHTISLPDLNKGRRVVNVWKEALNAASPFFYETIGEVLRFIRFGSPEAGCGFISELLTSRSLLHTTTA